MVSDNNKTVTKVSVCAPKARILIADDTRMNLIVMKGLLKQTGMQIDTADSGRECLLLTEKSRYHIIFLDIRMPEMDGIETLRRLLTLEKNINKGIPIIALTANAISGTKNEYIEEGFSDYLSKPVDPEELMKILLKYLPGELVQDMKAEKRDAPISDDGTGEMPNIAGLDTALGIQSCGTAQTFQKALSEFYMTAKDRIQEIGYYIQTENYNNYTIKVHTLKSSARLIGAEKLSEMARHLEECGNHENIREIKQKTAELMEHYGKLAEGIGAYINGKGNNHERPVIEYESLMDALHTIYEFVEIFDFESADSIMEMLDEYTIPDEYQESMLKLKVLTANVDRDNIMCHIKVMMERTHTETAEKNSINIPDINVESALWAFGGSVDEYINILKVFIEDENKRIQQMDECIRTQNIELYTIYAHSIKSSAANVGAMELSKLAEQLEMAGKENNFEYIHGSHDDFVTKTNHVIDGLICFLRQRTDWNNQGKAEGSKEFLLENLAIIETALMDYDMNMAEEALNRLNNMQWSEAVSSMISQIGQKMLVFDYEDARSLVVELLINEQKGI